ncbi:MAG: hypothetical protein IPM93_20900 [Candidatus Obscuribacter sp.]|nr:hypothetical protein [Candidatus Obscuribacter sp.]
MNAAFVIDRNAEGSGIKDDETLVGLLHGQFESDRFSTCVQAGEKILLVRISSEERLEAFVKTVGRVIAKPSPGNPGSMKIDGLYLGSGRVTNQRLPNTTVRCLTCTRDKIDLMLASIGWLTSQQMAELKGFFFSQLEVR